MSKAEWQALAERAIGRSIESLRSRSYDDIPIEPLYARPSTGDPRPWRATEAWTVAQRVDHPDPEAANRFALLDLEGGADALTLVTAASPFARGFGVAATGENLDAALRNVELDFIRLRLDAGGDCLATAEALAGLVEDRRMASAGLDIDLGYDPIGTKARTGRADEPSAYRQIVDLATRAGLAGCPLLADGRPYHEAGAGEAQELAAVLATGVACLRQLETDGIALDRARDLCAVLLAADADLFLGIAKLRTVRRLWARIETASGLDPKPLRLHVETSWRMMTRYDPWTNVMRTTAAAVAAGLGGADIVTMLPMTLPLGLPDGGARRLARNTQRVLIDEASLAKVEDPAGGAGALEALTDALCAQAWALFQEIEREGGIEASLRGGGLTRRIAETAERRARSLATLRSGVVGTSRFPSLLPSDLEVLAVEPRPGPTAGVLPSVRDAEPFEALRDKAETAAAAGHRPEVFLATVGSPAASGQHAAYAANVFAAAGIAAEIVVIAREKDELAEAFRASGLRVACICGLDAACAGDAGTLAATLRTAGASRVFAIGAASEALRGAQIDALIHDGCDALRILADALEAASAMPGAA